MRLCGQIFITQHQTSIIEVDRLADHVIFTFGGCFFYPDLEKKQRWGQSKLWHILASHAYWFREFYAVISTTSPQQPFSHFRDRSFISVIQASAEVECRALDFFLPVNMVAFQNYYRGLRSFCCRLTLLFWVIFKVPGRTL